MPSSALLSPDTTPVLHPAEFEKIRRLAYEHCGIDLHDGKQGLVAARLSKKLRELGLRTFQEYYDHVTSDRSGAAMATMIDFLTTNHTSFFREPRHFDFLRKTIYPTLRTRAQIHIWSAACSSGEEPYSIAMSLLEEGGAEAAASICVKASDISTRVLETARRGIYPADRFQGIPMPMLQRYLLKGHNASTDLFRFRNEVRSMITFEHFNLMDPIPGSYRCSVIFCRNIMIYFDKPTQQSLIARLSARLEDGGYLLIGHSESLNAISHRLDYIAPATYRKPVRQNGRS